MIRAHESMLELIRKFGESGSVEQLAEIDRTLFDLYDALERVKVLSAIGALEGCRGCDEALAIIKGEMGEKP